MMTSDLEQRIESFWSIEKWREHRLCLAVSGGADSVALLCAMAAIFKRLNLTARLVVGHVNHGLRGAESEGDAHFVQTLAESLSLQCKIHLLSCEEVEKEAARVGSREAAYRNLRYQALRNTATEFGARYIVTAHTKNDQLETILHRLFRGSGPAGWTGMAAVRPINDALCLVRPMLEMDRNDIVTYLQEMCQNYREDSSNATLDYTRNKIRHRLVPVLEEVFSEHWSDSILRLAALSRDVENLVERDVTRLLEQNVEQTGTGITIMCNDLKNEPPFVVRELFRYLWKDQNWPRQEMGVSQWERLEKMVQGAGPERSEFPGSIVAVRRERTLVISSVR